MLSRVGRRSISVLAMALTVLVGGALGLSPAWAAPARASGATAPSGGGYVASARTVRSAQMTLQVPAVHCVSGKSSTVTAGMVGSTQTGSTRSPWQVSVVASCRGRIASYRGVESDSFGRSTLLRVRPGDRVKLIRPSASEYEIDDLTAHSGAGGASSSGSGEQPRLVSPVLFGVQVRGSVARALLVHVLRAQVNATLLPAATHRPQRQISNGRVVARPSALARGGAFTVTVS